MIKINLTKENDILKKITFKGHAGYDELGKDIVCAAVSSTMLCTVNAILLLNGNSIETFEYDNKFVIDVLSNDNITIKLLENMLRCLKSLEEKYPQNIRIR